MKYEKEYDNMLDECNPEIKIGNITLSPSRVLKEMDPIAYDCGYADWTDSENLSEDDEDSENLEEDDEVQS